MWAKLQVMRTWCLDESALATLQDSHLDHPLG